MAPAAWLLSLLAFSSLASLPVLPPPPPPPSPVAPALPLRGGQSGSQLRINGLVQQARWQLHQQPRGGVPSLWLPLEVLENQLGMSSRSTPQGALRLEWFGRELEVPASGQRSLDDEVAVDVGPLLEEAGVRLAARGSQLDLELPATALVAVRSSRQPGLRRVVLDLEGPAVIRRQDDQLWLGLSSSSSQRAELEALGLTARLSGSGMELQARPGKPERVFSLGTPARIVIDLEPDAAAAEQRPRDPRLLALLGREIQWDQLERQGVRINAVRLDPRSSSLALRPLTRSGGMEGLSSLQQLAAQENAVVAINGGYFNRVKRLPLGAVRADGRWFSGPILNRGVVAWSPGDMPRFGRLSLVETVSDERGNRLPLVVLNSGYLQRGLSRYTTDWGATYRALSGQERGLLLRAGRVQQLYTSSELEQGVPLNPGESLLVARGGTELPWREGDSLSLSSRPSNDLGQAPNVVGGGPLLLQGGRIVLNGAAENFSAAFLRQGAPRTVIGSDGSQLWLLTLQGAGNPGPSLGDTAQLLQQLGIRDALNLDGGSSTGLVLGGVMAVKGRGVAGSVHHGLGLVTSDGPTGAGLNRPSQPTARVP
jgi:hypothetical protein